ncbi:MAG: hypothetical protein M3Y42_01390 [Actinomycetota bacterium]|nr:hypothetical protein [Actinomycetota bacterium]
MTVPVSGLADGLSTTGFELVGVEDGLLETDAFEVTAAAGLDTAGFDDGAVVLATGLEATVGTDTEPDPAGLGAAVQPASRTAAIAENTPSRIRMNAKTARGAR